MRVEEEAGCQGWLKRSCWHHQLPLVHDARAGTHVRVRACEWVLLSAHACVVLACLRGSRSVCGGGKGRVHPGSETAYPEFFEAIKKIGLFHETPI